LQTSKKSIIINTDRESEVNAMFNVGEKLKKYRQRKSMSQQEFAKLLGISQNYLSEIESGIHTPSLKMLINISQKMNTTIQKLISEKSA
jgi:XRE family transcriptional regulator, fatty acid utilization regulator